MYYKKSNKHQQQKIKQDEENSLKKMKPWTEIVCATEIKLFIKLSHKSLMLVSVSIQWSFSS